ncbi:exonuclease 1 [Thraustotheca clavata]|uniref:Exonuclease 1 n=1 Tax=Thraustotheca clavata TaxID=74557 RepID=A0A1V9ZLW4_9STRA|nr:exonuclease 1 [Thraustotheca clavata]
MSCNRYRGKRVGIDAYGWLYKGAYSCAVELGLGTIDSYPSSSYDPNAPTEPYIAHCLARLELLLENGITPIFVFDGAPLPAKKATNLQRMKSRALHRERGRELHAKGDTSKSFGAFCQALSVTSAMARKFFVTLAVLHPKIECIIAPYEADAQLAFLSKERLIDIVMSEDSDCIPYGCRKVLFKFNGDGFGEEFRRRYIGANEGLTFIGWSDEMFIQYCVLVGCDYCLSLKGIGPVTAHELVSRCKTPEKISTTIFDPTTKRARILNPLRQSASIFAIFKGTLDFLGNLDAPQTTIANIANGTLDPKTLEPYPPPIIHKRKRPSNDKINKNAKKTHTHDSNQNGQLTH